MSSNDASVIAATSLTAERLVSMLPYHFELVDVDSVMREDGIEFMSHAHPLPDERLVIDDAVADDLSIGVPASLHVRLELPKTLPWDSCRLRWFEILDLVLPKLWESGPSYGWFREFGGDPIVTWSPNAMYLLEPPERFPEHHPRAAYEELIEPWPGISSVRSLPQFTSRGPHHAPWFSGQLPNRHLFDHELETKRSDQAERLDQLLAVWDGSVSGLQLIAEVEDEFGPILDSAVLIGALIRRFRSADDHIDMANGVWWARSIDNRPDEADRLMNVLLDSCRPTPDAASHDSA